MLVCSLFSRKWNRNHKKKFTWKKEKKQSLGLGPWILSPLLWKHYEIYFASLFSWNHNENQSLIVNAWISTQLQISARFELVPLLWLKIWNKHPPSNKRPLPPLRENRDNIWDMYSTLNECDIRNSSKLLFFKVERVCSSFPQ